MKKHFFLSFCMIVPLLFLLLGSVSCSKDEKTDMHTPPVITIPDTTGTSNLPSVDTTSGVDTAGARFLALGDSYTIGQSVQPNERFPAQTVQLLRDDSLHIADPQYIATTGWTTNNLMYAINSQNLKNTFDVVTLLIGVNDQYQHHDTTGYAAKFEALLLKAIALAGARKEHVFVLSIPDYSATPFVAAPNKPFVSMQIDEFNEINKQIAHQYKVTYIDITPSSRLALQDPSLVAFDDLHPSGKEYKVWASLLAPYIKAVLK